MSSNENPTERMKELQALRSTYSEDIRSAEMKASEVDDQMKELLRNTISELFPDIDKDRITYFRSWGWKCESDKNPFDNCVYDGYEDPCFDECLFCHDPFERK